MLFISNERETETLMPHPHHHNMFDQTSVCSIPFPLFYLRGK